MGEAESASLTWVPSRVPSVWEAAVLLEAWRNPGKAEEVWNYSLEKGEGSPMAEWATCEP